MIIPKRTKFLLLSLLILLNLILHFQATSQEIGNDSFLVHMTANSISEFGQAKWILSPYSFWGMYPYSEVSAVPFLLSGIFQSTGINMRFAIFLYCIILSIFSIFTSYIMANAITNDDVFKIIAAFTFSTAPNVVQITTWTIPARGLFIVFAPMLIFTLLKTRFNLKYITLVVLSSLFLYSVHHLIYFVIPIFFSLIVTWLLFKGYIVKFPKKLVFDETRLKIPSFVIISGFILMFSVPFITGAFIEQSRFYPIYEDYVRYIGLLILPAIGGLGFIIFKPYKNFQEIFILLSAMFLTFLIYEQTYMKDFLSIIATPFICIGLLNVLELRDKKYGRIFVCLFLLAATIFIGFYQFIHEYDKNNYLERYMDESSYCAGEWMKEYVDGSSVSNDVDFGRRIASVSDTSHMFIANTKLDYTYGFVPANLSSFIWYPVTSDKFWFDVGDIRRDPGEYNWERLNALHFKPKDFNITCFVENPHAYGMLVWNHALEYSKLLTRAYKEGNLIYDGGDVRLWDIRFF